MCGWIIDPANPRRIVAPSIGGYIIVAKCETEGTARVLLHRMKNFPELEEAVRYAEKTFQMVQRDRGVNYDHPLADPQGLIIEDARKKCTVARFAAEGRLPTSLRDMDRGER